MESSSEASIGFNMWAIEGGEVVSGLRDRKKWWGTPLMSIKDTPALYVVVRWYEREVRLPRRGLRLAIAFDTGY